MSAVRKTISKPRISRKRAHNGTSPSGTGTSPSGIGTSPSAGIGTSESGMGTSESGIGTSQSVIGTGPSETQTVTSCLQTLRTCGVCLANVNSNFYSTLKKHAATHLGILPFKVRKVFFLLIKGLVRQLYAIFFS